VTTVPPLSLDDLALESSGSGFSRVIGPDWTFADRVFGGYTAALALTAAHEVATHPHAVSARFGFLEAAVPGPITLEVTALRAGRSLWTGRVLATQAGRPVLTCEVWFADRPAAAPGSPGVAISPGPEQCPSLSWLPDMWPCMGFLEERALDYPAGPTDRSGGPQLAVWARPVKDIGPDPFQGQVLDLMFADAHLMDAALRCTGLGESLGFSLDISITWETPRPSPGWLLLRAEAESGADGFVTCRGTVCAPDGALRATALTQGRNWNR
jgi:acyl-CoA thioesterase